MKRVILVGKNVDDVMLYLEQYGLRLLASDTVNGNSIKEFEIYALDSMKRDEEWGYGKLSNMPVVQVESGDVFWLMDKPYPETARRSIIERLQNSEEIHCDRFCKFMESQQEELRKRRERREEIERMRREVARFDAEERARQYYFW